MICQDYPPATGGVQTYAEKLSHHLAIRGHDLCLLAPGPSLPEDPPWVLRRFRGNPVFFGLKILWELRRQMQRFQPDVVLHLQWTSALWLFLPSFFFPSSARSICLLHGRELLQYHFWASLRRKILKRCDLLIANSHVVSVLAQRIIGRSIAIPVIWPGVDLQRFYPCPEATVDFRKALNIPPDSSVILNLARQIPRKNTRSLLVAFAMIRGRFPKALLFIAGVGPELPRLRHLAEKLQLGDSIRFVGKVPEGELILWYNLAAVFCMPALSQPDDVEGFGIVFAEAAACGIPALAIRCGGVSEVVHHGETGWLVSQGYPSALAEGLERLMENGILRQQLGKTARLWAEKHLGWSRNAEQMEALIRSSLRWKQCESDVKQYGNSQ
ncbi:MAG TPA: glycosyltransferase family 4 protein [Fibrobacteraceae bacterium]|nr:glycosyltransferase family 4 protein [Fibrobacteraceae bacterium]